MLKLFEIGSKKKEKPSSKGEGRDLSAPEVQAREIVIEAKSEALRIRDEAEKDAREIRRKAEELEKKFEERQDSLDRRAEQLERREGDLLKRQENLAQQLKTLEREHRQLLKKLEASSAMTREEAKKELLRQTEVEAKADLVKIIREREEEAEQKAEVRARDILVSAIQRAGTECVGEYTTSRVKLPDEDFKGRIIGREGRNIKAFERATGVTVDMDEPSDEARLSSFDGVRREVARLALERLIADGRIQPARIEAEVEKAQKDLEVELRKVGEKLVYDVGLSGVPSELFPLLGRYKFRTSYGQSLIRHSLEVVDIGKVIAAELGADVELVKKAALLHDLGKVKTAEAEGPHAGLTRQLLSKFKLDEKLINAAAAHHQEEEFKSVEAVIVHIADAVSGARPGARFEDYEAYVKRMKDLENTALGFGEVKEAFALAAGREVRIIVKPEEVDDAAVTLLSRKIAKKIEEEQAYPGQVKVTVIKEVKASETAK